jgi:hypothetical protein
VSDDQKQLSTTAVVIIAIVFTMVCLGSVLLLWTTGLPPE